MGGRLGEKREERGKKAIKIKGRRMVDVRMVDGMDVGMLEGVWGSERDVRMLEEM